jgi:hypothetical protein
MANPEREVERLDRKATAAHTKRVAELLDAMPHANTTEAKALSRLLRTVLGGRRLHRSARQSQSAE